MEPGTRNGRASPGRPIAQPLDFPRLWGLQGARRNLLSINGLWIKIGQSYVYGTTMLSGRPRLRELRPVLLAVAMALLAYLLAMIAPTRAYDARADYCEDHPAECR